jgi:hypothetical protein
MHSESKNLYLLEARRGTVAHTAAHTGNANDN